MQPHEKIIQFPRISLLRASAIDFGLNIESSILNAILSMGLSFSSEAEDGAFSSIYLVYGQGDCLVNFTITEDRDDGYKLLIEHVMKSEPPVYLGGLSAVNRAGGGDWVLENAHVKGVKVGFKSFFDSISDLHGLVLIDKEVSDRLVTED